MSNENNQDICLNCGKSLKPNELEFCEDCEDMICGDDFSYYPGDAVLRKYFYKVRPKINLSKYKLTILGLFGLMVYIISNVYFQSNFIASEYFTIITFIYTRINVVLVGIGIFGSIYLSVNRSLSSKILMVTGFLLFLMISEFSLFVDDILVYLQYIGSFIVFTTGVIGFANSRERD